MNRGVTSNRGFTLVELLVSMSLGLIVMLAVFSTYAYLGRNLTRLSYRSVLETQSRKFLVAFASDIRNAKNVISATSTTLALNVYNDSDFRGPKPLMKVEYKFDGTSLTSVTSNPNGTTPITVLFNYPLNTNSVDVLTVIPSFSFLYYTSSGGNPVSQFNASVITPLSVKQVAVNFNLQAGAAAIQGLQGTLSTLPVTSGWLQLINRQPPDGS